jgi:Ca2+-binding RTX toxin-like protein
MRTVHRQRARTARAAKVAVLVTGLGLLLAASPGTALAGTASVGADGIALYQAVAGEDNDLRVQERPVPGTTLKAIVFSDDVPISLGSGCYRIVDSVRVAGCNVAAGVSLVRASLRDLSDFIRPGATNAPITTRFSATGGPNHDDLIGTSQRDVLDGDSGPDRLRGNNGPDTLEGDIGDDLLEGGAGRDQLFGEGDNDTVNADDNAGGDFVDCGPGNDSATVNLGDSVTNCETVTTVP